MPSSLLSSLAGRLCGAHRLDLVSLALEDALQQIAPISEILDD